VLRGAGCSHPITAGSRLAYGMAFPCELVESNMIG
jgi:hypothetical protein